MEKDEASLEPIIRGKEPEDEDDDVKVIKDKCRKLDAEIELLTAEGLHVDELEVHVRMLHEYNEIKDYTQDVLGKIAVLQGVTVKDLHKKYELGMNE